MPRKIKTHPTRPKAAHRYEVVQPQPPIGFAGKRYHFIGAGGIGMSGLAKLLIKNDAIVTGSDLSPSSATEKLCKLGADVKTGHSANNLPDKLDAVVASAAITDGNPELEQARRRGCKIYKYAQMLGLLMNSYEAVAIAGTHGKSTTTAWLAFILERADLSPNFVVGADVPQLGGSSGTGTGRYFVAEACEYDRSFLNLRPAFAAILNVEQDHLDYYKDEDDIVRAFSEFAARLKPSGVLITNGQDKNVAKVLAELPESLRYQTFGLNTGCDFRAENLALEDGFYSFDVMRKKQPLGRVRILLPGIHNVLNALAVTALALNMGLQPRQVLGILGDFEGVDRRLMLKTQIGGVTVLDDYAHHPTEIRASLEAIRQRYNPKRLWCVFQPHQYSRTRFLLDDFAESFKLADVVIVPEIYFVRDTAQSKKQVNSQVLVERIRSNGAEAVFIEGFASICNYLKHNVARGELVVTMGAGDIWKVADEFIQWLRANSQTEISVS